MVKTLTVKLIVPEETASKFNRLNLSYDEIVREIVEKGQRGFAFQTLQKLEVKSVTEES